MEDNVFKSLEGSGFIGLLLTWGICILVPFCLAVSGIENLRSGSRRCVGTLKLIGGISFGIVVLVFFVFFGRDLFRITLQEGGVWLVGLVAAAVVCIVAFPMCLVGRRLRTAREESSSRDLAIGLAGLFAIASSAGLLYYFVLPAAGLGFGLLGAGAVVTGWFRCILVPDIDDT